MAERKVQSYAQALTELLDLKGQEPWFIDNRWQAVLEVTDMLAARRYSVTSVVTPSANSVGDTQQLIVPPGQTWLVMSLTGQLVAQAVGDQFAVTIEYAPAAGSNTAIAAGDLVTTVNSNQSVRVVYQPPRPFIANAGDRFRVRIDAFALGGGGANRTLGLFGLVARFGPNAG